MKEQTYLRVQLAKIQKCCNEINKANYEMFTGHLHLVTTIMSSETGCWLLFTLDDKIIFIDFMKGCSTYFSLFANFPGELKR